MAVSDELICTRCSSKVPPDKNGCSCGMSREQIRDEIEALNREANLRMMPELPDYLVDEPWGHR